MFQLASVLNLSRIVFSKERVNALARIAFIEGKECLVLRIKNPRGETVYIVLFSNTLMYYLTSLTLEELDSYLESDFLSRNMKVRVSFDKPNITENRDRFLKLLYFNCVIVLSKNQFADFLTDKIVLDIITEFLSKIREA